ncbi:hypothetical protein GGF31_008118 [Allomyces arbusculus]|nr:hypothetical protein GGF31_008118 [Allomyces arbusculus]
MTAPPRPTRTARTPLTKAAAVPTAPLTRARTRRRTRRESRAAESDDHDDAMAADAHLENAPVADAHEHAHATQPKAAMLRALGLTTTDQPDPARLVADVSGYADTDVVHVGIDDDDHDDDHDDDEDELGDGRGEGDDDRDDSGSEYDGEHDAAEYSDHGDEFEDEDVDMDAEVDGLGDGDDAVATPTAAAAGGGARDTAPRSSKRRRTAESFAFTFELVKRQRLAQAPSTSITAPASTAASETASEPASVSTTAPTSAAPSTTPSAVASPVVIPGTPRMASGAATLVPPPPSTAEIKPSPILSLPKHMSFGALGPAPNSSSSSTPASVRLYKAVTSIRTGLYLPASEIGKLVPRVGLSAWRPPPASAAGTEAAKFDLTKTFALAKPPTPTPTTATSAAAAGSVSALDNAVRVLGSQPGALAVAALARRPPPFAYYPPPPPPPPPTPIPGSNPAGAATASSPMTPGPHTQPPPFGYPPHAFAPSTSAAHAAHAHAHAAVAAAAAAAAFPPNAFPPGAFSPAAAFAPYGMPVPPSPYGSPAAASLPPPPPPPPPLLAPALASTPFRTLPYSGRTLPAPFAKSPYEHVPTPAAGFFGKAALEAMVATTAAAAAAVSASASVSAGTTALGMASPAMNGHASGSMGPFGAAPSPQPAVVPSGPSGAAPTPMAGTRWPTTAASVPPSPSPTSTGIGIGLVAPQSQPQPSAALANSLGLMGPPSTNLAQSAPAAVAANGTVVLPTPVTSNVPSPTSTVLAPASTASSTSAPPVATNSTPAGGRPRKVSFTTQMAAEAILMFQQVPTGGGDSPAEEEMVSPPGSGVPGSPAEGSVVATATAAAVGL